MKAQRIAVAWLATMVVAATIARAENPVQFADPNLKQAVIEHLPQWGVSTANPTPTDMLALRGLWAGSRGIRDLTGLEYATNLTDLHLGDNRIVNLSPLSTLVNLRNLSLSTNQITDLRPLSGLRGLESLEMLGAQISDMSPLSGLTNLVRLNLGYNERIADISALGGMTKLQYLNLRNNQIRDIRPLDGLTSLTELDLLWNVITDVNALSALKNLTYLNMGSNKISDIGPLAGLTKLTVLILGSYQEIQITDISALAGLTNLTVLDLEYHPIRDITPLAGLTHMVSLNLSRNRITDIRALAGMTELKELYLHGYPDRDNEITDISVLSKLTKLEILTLDGNLITDISPLAGLKSLQELTLTGNPLDGKACAVYIPVIKLNNPGLKISYDACLGRVYTLTVSATHGGSVPKPGEGAFICNDGESVPLEAVAESGYHFTSWSGTAVDAGKVAGPDAPTTTMVVDADYALVANFKTSSMAEDFEKGKLGPGWSSSGYVSWYVTSEDRHAGQYCVRAGAIEDNQTTTLTWRAKTAEGRIRFWRKVSCEGGYDEYRFSIDGKVHETLSGEYEWQEVSFPLTAGSHTFTWEYRKDISGSYGADTVYLDDVSIPAAP